MPINSETKAGAEEMAKGARNFWYSRKITLSNYDPRRKFETEEFGVIHDSFKEAREMVQEAVQKRIDELRGVTEIKTA